MLLLVLRRFLLPTLVAILVTPIVLSVALRAPITPPTLNELALVGSVCGIAMLVFGLPTGLWLARRGASRWSALGLLLLAGAAFGYLVFVIGGLFSSMSVAVVLGISILGCPSGMAAALIWYLCNLDLYAPARGT